MKIIHIVSVSEARPILSLTELQPIKCIFQRCIDYVDIARCSSIKQGWSGKTSYFWAKCINIL